MKKTVKVIFCAAFAAAVLAGCGGSKTEETTAAATEGTTAAAETTAAEETAETYSEEELTDDASITLGNYIGLERTVTKQDVTDAQVDAQMEYMKTAYPAEISGRAAQKGDVANIDYTGTKDGTAFDGGTASGYDLQLGSGQFIEGFEDGVIGMEIGEEKDLNLTFPEDYDNEDLAGQAVVFHVKLNSLKDPESTKLDDALARRALNDVNATLDTLRERIRETLEIQSEGNFFNGAGNELVSQAVENSQITVDPQKVEQTYNELKQTYQAYADQYGLDLETFLSVMLGTDPEGLKASAEEVVKQEMVLNEIVDKEGLSATDEQKDKLAQINYYPDAETLIAAVGEETADHLFRMGAAYYYLIDKSVLTEAPETEAAESEAAAGEAAEAEAGAESEAAGETAGTEVGAESEAAAEAAAGTEAAAESETAAP